MPRPGSLQNYQRHAPLVAATLLLCLFAVYLAWQVMQWMALMAAAETAGTDAVQATGAAPDLARLEQLFGPPPASQAGGALPASDLNLTLHGSFVHADPARSSAIIEQSGKPPERYSPGDEITSGVRLERVLPDRVELSKDGRQQVLAFPTSRSSGTSSNAGDYPDPSTGLPPGTAPVDPEAALMEQQMEALRQQMEGVMNEQAQPTDAPMEDN
ncbi:type II secretion system protein N [Stutzerimonas urumqiensis]|uniref:type II secretion system protein N n=1 Tax=Stutzerimonas urumqiensis TaxID=638269 RepID=UPI000EB09BD9|nr:type II secretion system protein N [Stutzerimonas urumqiensis]